MKVHLEAQTLVKDANIKNNYTNSYNNAIGIRVGETSGLTFKHYFASSNAVEGIVSFWPNSLGITGLYEQYVSTNITGLNWYFGGGGHINMGYMRSMDRAYSESRYYAYRYTYPGVGIGVDGIAGIEYKIPKIPIAFSFDLKPFVEINNSPDIFIALDPGFGAKFTF